MFGLWGLEIYRGFKPIFAKLSAMVIRSVFMRFGDTATALALTPASPDLASMGFIDRAYYFRKVLKENRIDRALKKEYQAFIWQIQAPTRTLQPNNFTLTIARLPRAMRDGISLEAWYQQNKASLQHFFQKKLPAYNVSLLPKSITSCCGMGCYYCLKGGKETNLKPLLDRQA